MGINKQKDSGKKIVKIVNILALAIMLVFYILYFISQVFQNEGGMGGAIALIIMVVLYFSMLIINIKLSTKYFNIKENLPIKTAHWFNIFGFIIILEEIILNFLMTFPYPRTNHEQELFISVILNGLFLIVSTVLSLVGNDEQSFP